ncbi:MAG: HAD hydrolase family protein [Rubrobacter sp.]|nr:HAD hydrolase family protein [Rubrobacter sp.]
MPKYLITRKTVGYLSTLAFDFDGTLLRRDLTITEITVGALRELREREVRLVVATGRRFECAREHVTRLGFRAEDPVNC